jgi:hypothetical protein
VAQAIDVGRRDLFAVPLDKGGIGGAVDDLVDPAPQRTAPLGLYAQAGRGDLALHNTRLLAGS